MPKFLALALSIRSNFLSLALKSKALSLDLQLEDKTLSPKVLKALFQVVIFFNSYLQIFCRRQ